MGSGLESVFCSLCLRSGPVYPSVAGDVRHADVEGEVRPRQGVGARGGGPGREGERDVAEAHAVAEATEVELCEPLVVDREPEELPEQGVVAVDVVAVREDADRVPRIIGVRPPLLRAHAAALGNAAPPVIRRRRSVEGTKSYAPVIGRMYSVNAQRGRSASGGPAGKLARREREKERGTC